MSKLLLVPLLLAVVSSAIAAPITYTVSGTGSGQGLQGYPATFENLPFSFVLNADTSNIHPFLVPDGSPYVANDSGTFTLGDTTGTISANFMGVLSSQSGMVDIYNDQAAPSVSVNQLFVLSSSDPTFVAYDLTTDIGPVAVSTILNPNNRPTAGIVNSSLGELLFTSVSDVTFSAELATPEPGGLALVGMGLLGLVLLSRKRFAA